MNEDAISKTVAELRDILRRRAPDIEWHTINGETDHEATLWVRVRAMQAAHLVQFVITVPTSDQADSNMIAARIINEALRLLRKQNQP